MLPLITTLLPLVGEVLDRVIPDKAAADKAKLEMQAKILDAAQQGALAQIEVNKAEANSGSSFRGGWRPYIGWVCGAALTYQFIVRPILPWAVNLFGANVPPMPSLDDMLWELVFAMLGLGTLRTYEKRQGVA